VNIEGRKKEFGLPQTQPQRQGARPVDPDGPSGRNSYSRSPQPFSSIWRKDGAFCLTMAKREWPRVRADILPCDGSVGFGQAVLPEAGPEQIPLALERFKAESARVMTVLDGFPRAGSTRRKRIHIADIAHLGGCAAVIASIDLTTNPNVKRGSISSPLARSLGPSSA